jgi:hypothetical protein
VADPSENPRFGHWLDPVMVTSCTFLKASLRRISWLLPLTSKGNPRSMERMMAVLLRRFPLGGINLGGVYRHGLVEGSMVERCSSTMSMVFLSLSVCSCVFVRFNMVVILIAYSFMFCYSSMCE